jgi:hydroxyacylglutathione hydrolase
MIIEQLTVGPFMENTWLVGEGPGGDAFVVDPGGENDRVLACAEKHGLSIRAIVNTHGHLDHISGASELMRKLAIPFHLHPDDAFLLEHADEACAMFGLPPIEVPAPVLALAAGKTLEVGALAMEVIHTPGHSPGGVCLRLGSDLFVGDTLFAGSIGRTDLPGGDMETLRGSILESLIDALPPATIIHCGHGPDSSLAEEATTNPFVTAWR